MYVKLLANASNKRRNMKHINFVTKNVQKGVFSGYSKLS